MVSPKLFNREVYMIIDQSASMARKDRTLGNKMRWQALSEVIEGHTFRILNEKNPIDGTPLCAKGEIVATFFSPNVPCPTIKYIQDPDQVEEMFQDNLPDQNTFITPTLDKVINLWKNRGRTEGKGAFIIIYVDGQFDDRDEFEKLVESTCKGLKNQDELKIIILGFGSEFEGCNFIEFNLRLGLNTSNYKDSKGTNYHLVTFDLICKIKSIINCLFCQFENPHTVLPSWAKEECLHLFS